MKLLDWEIDFLISSLNEASDKLNDLNSNGLNVSYDLLKKLECSLDILYK